MNESCAIPPTDDTLLAWWTGELEAAELDLVEEHLLSCEECARRGQALCALADGVGGIFRRGELSAVVLPAVVERLRREGRRIREYRVRPAEGVQCTVSPEDDVVLARLAAKLTGVSRLDLVVLVDGAPQARLSDLPFEPDGEELVFTTSAHALRALPAHVQQLRLLAVDPQGERALGEYTFHHTPWPGAAGA